MAADAPDPDREIASVIAAKISSIRFDPDPASEWAEAMPAVAIAESRAASAAAARALGRLCSSDPPSVPQRFALGGAVPPGAASASLNLYSEIEISVGAAGPDQYAWAQTAADRAGRPQQMHRSDGLVSASSGRQRIVAALSRLTRASHSASPHHPARANPLAARR